MIDRYADPRIAEIFNDEQKLLRWQETELAVVRAYAERGQPGDPTMEQFEQIRRSLLANAPDKDWWLECEKILHHDLNAFIEERLRHLLLVFQDFFHRGITSYDTEESAFVRALAEATSLVFAQVDELIQLLAKMALKYRYTPMWFRTHGQGAEAGSFGKRILSWREELTTALAAIEYGRNNLRYSKISGACGNYTSIDPEIEKRALEILGLEPFYGATQILPRVLFLPLTSGLLGLVSVLDKIMTDIRLGARSGPYVLYREPFGKGQKGSSAMPHKKNTIVSEQETGLARLALGSFTAIALNIPTWEERSIEQSSVERVAWPDLFHVTMQALKNCTRVMSGLNVYPECMLKELHSARGCYATTEAQRVLKDLIKPHGLAAEDGYRMIQLAAFNLFSSGREAEISTSLAEADKKLEVGWGFSMGCPTLCSVIKMGALQTSSELEATEEQVARWNRVLRKVFVNPADSDNCRRWDEIFTIEYLLRNEHVLFEKLLGIKTTKEE